MIETYGRRRLFAVYLDIIAELYIESACALLNIRTPYKVGNATRIQERTSGLLKDIALYDDIAVITTPL